MLLLDYILLYERSPEAAAIQQGYQAVNDLLWRELENLHGEVFIAHAEKSLAEWEKLYGLDVRPDSSPERRRERVRAKMRGSGTTTLALVESVAQSFSNGEVQVTEHNPESYFEVLFVSQKGKPPGLDALKEAIEDIKPAHLGVMYIFTLVTHEAIRGAGYTHAQLLGRTHTFIREELQTEEDS